MERKIIQITFAQAEDESYFSVLYALCNDGTLWSWALGASNAEWKIMDNVPQP